MSVVKTTLYIVQKGGLWLFFSHAVTILGQFFLIKYLAVEGSKELFAQFSIVMLINAGMMMIFFGALTQWALRYYQEFHERKRVEEYFHIFKTGSDDIASRSCNHIVRRGTFCF